ncbi:TnsA-like heteromeric transposase endonuclease subunit [Streptomyces sp. STCH 565 A]|uniref:TnsA-like heteromeric transposase endonuclease subunit n=1 Tax=Streptomyces sp. STCH 565 A TaxID=2950532 RepID=UPI002075FB43|nr:TnsA-like heteromeric transposase endonuclease subunit [Streptomyces sp. STCH 565 A]MCM8554268.1 TnsA-like heteromeric transposase endonuclease subunit [Streptomyces sp. STCH 565 A]
MRVVTVHHLNEQGQLVSTASADLVGVRLEERLPPTDPVAYHGRPGKLSKWWSATTGGHVVCGSLRRRRVALELDFDPDIAWIGGEPVELRWQGARGKRRLRPDFMVRTVDGARHAVVVEPDKCGPQWREDLEVLRGVAAAACWQVSVRRVPKGVYLENLELTGDYRQPMRIPAGEQAALEAAFDRERPIREAVLDSGVPTALATDLAYRLVWQRRLAVHWDRPLGPWALARLAGDAA